MTAAEYDVQLATKDDITGILDLQECNLPDRGGTLSVGFSRQWFEAELGSMPVVVARRRGRVVGYLVSSSLAAHADVPIVQAMLRVYPGSPGAYLYGPICVARSERGRGMATALFAVLRSQLPGREGILFIRGDNPASLRAHAKMGMREVAQFTHDGSVHAVFVYDG